MSVSAIRGERKSEASGERSYAAAGTFIDYLERFNRTSEDYAAGVAAHVLRGWDEPEHRINYASTRITKVSGSTPSYAIASAAASVCIAAMRASMSATSMRTA